jgi:hypothetical protein
MQNKTTFRGLGYTLHLLQPHANGSPAACGSTDAVLSVRLQDTERIPASVLCPQCRVIVAGASSPGPGESSTLAA